MMPKSYNLAYGFQMHIFHFIDVDIVYHILISKQIFKNPKIFLFFKIKFSNISYKFFIFYNIFVFFIFIIFNVNFNRFFHNLNKY